VRPGRGAQPDTPSLYEETVEHVIRCRDPFLGVRKRWLIRRLAPDCWRIELSALPKERHQVRLLHAMG
jgi:hypothetical protein